MSLSGLFLFFCFLIGIILILLAASGNIRRRVRYIEPMYYDDGKRLVYVGFKALYWNDNWGAWASPQQETLWIRGECRSDKDPKSNPKSGIYVCKEMRECYGYMDHPGSRIFLVTAEGSVDHREIAYRASYSRILGQVRGWPFSCRIDFWRKGDEQCIISEKL